MAELLATIGVIGGKLLAGAQTAGSFLAANAGAISTALSTAGTVYSGLRAASGARQEAKSMVEKGEAEFAKGQREAMQRRKETNLVLSRQRAVAAASGAGATDPSVLAVMERTQREGDYNAMVDMYNGAINRADLRRAAKTRLKEGRSALIGSAIDAGTTIYGDIAKRKREYSIY